MKDTVPRGVTQRLVLTACLAGLSSATAGAQPRADLQVAPRFTLDAGANAVSWTAFPGVATASPRQSGVTLAPGIHLDGTRHTVDATGSWTNDPTGGGIVQGSGVLSLYTATRGGMRGEFTGSANASRLADGFASARAMGGVRLHASRSGGGGWVGAQAGLAGYDSTWRRVRQPEAGLWYALPSRAESGTSSGALVVTVTPTTVAYDGATDRYTDIEGGARLVRGRGELGVSVGTRLARTASVTLLGGAQAWGTVATTVWMTPQVALTASGGMYPVDAIMRFPGGRFAAAGVRLAFGRAPVVDAASSTARVPVDERPRAAEVADAPAARPTLTVGPLDGTLRAITVVLASATSARRVEVAGSFSNWEPVLLSSVTPGVFRRTVRMPRGKYEVAVRVEGGDWVAPRGLAVVRDEFGGESGLLVVDR